MNLENLTYAVAGWSVVLALVAVADAWLRGAR